MTIPHTPRSYTLPDCAVSFVEKRLKTLSERLLKINPQRYASSLVAYDCWAEKPHEFSGAECIAGEQRELWLWKDIAADFGVGKDREWFARRLPEILTARTDRMKNGCEQLPVLTRRKFTVRTPEFADRVIENRLQVLGMTFPQYVASLVSYDCWCERPHSITGPSCSGDGHDEFTLWAEIVRDFGKPGKTGSWFQAKLEEIRTGKA